MKRPILIAAIGFGIGIIGGLYFNIVLLICIGLPVCFFLLMKIKKLKNLIRIIRLWINKKVIVLFMICFLVGNIYILYLEKEYDNIYNTLTNIKVIGTVVSDKNEKEYSSIYLIKVEKINGKKVRKKNFWISIPKKSQSTTIQYADKIILEGEYIKPEGQRNYRGFDDSIYLKSIKNYGTIKQTGKLEVLRRDNLDFIHLSSHSIKRKIIEKASKLFPEETKGIFLGILVGYTDFITEETRQSFSDSSLSHLLAVSGAHVAYVVIGVTILLQKMKISKKSRKIITCLFLIFYLYLIGFTASATRAVIMNIISILQFNFYRKQDTATTINFSVLMILLNNPYTIFNIGFLLSYAGAIGIIVLMEKIKDLDTNHKETEKKKIIEYLKNIGIVTISAQIMILPIIVYYFNTVSFTFILSNLLAGLLIGPITILGFIVILLSFINLSITSFIIKFYNLLLVILLKTTNFISKIPLSKLYVKTPSLLVCLFYYIVVIWIVIVINIQKSQRSYLKRKLKVAKKKIKYRIIKNKKKISLVMVLVLIMAFMYYQIPQNLKIYFIDVGQGDSCLIVTPMNKKILIDSGGSESYDVGKNILLPYLLDRGITSLDYVFVSHFDTDHVRTVCFMLCKK